MSKKETVKRYILMVIGLFFIALGIAFTKSAELGVTTISSVPNVLSIRFTAITLGNWLIIWNSLFVLIQIAILRKKFRPVQFIQIPLSFLLGYFTDFNVLLTNLIPDENYAMKLLMVAVGVIVLGFGISISVISDAVMNPGEAIVKVLADVSGKSFASVKIVFDISCVALAVMLSLLLFDFSIVGVREGTLIAALTTGFVIKFFNKLLTKPLNRILK